MASENSLDIALQKSLDAEAKAYEALRAGDEEGFNRFALITDRAMAMAERIYARLQEEAACS